MKEPLSIRPDEVRALLAQGALLLDVRTPQEYAAAHIPGAHCLPLNRLPMRMKELPPGGAVIVCCLSGRRSAAAATLLAEAGRWTVYDFGAVAGWDAPLVPESEH